MLPKHLRIGLTQARHQGAKVATADALVFLDAHSEGQPDWLRPLLQRIKDKRTAVLTPIIDTLHTMTLEYLGGDAIRFQVMFSNLWVV